MVLTRAFRCLLLAGLLPCWHVALASSFREQILESIGTEYASVLDEAIGDGRWNESRTALAISLRPGERTRLLVILQPCSSTPTVVDVSSVESRNLGKLGIDGYATYDFVESEAVRWLPRQDELIQIEVITRAWKQGQRLTAREPLVLRQDGTVLWR